MAYDPIEIAPMGACMAGGSTKVEETSRLNPGDLCGEHLACGGGIVLHVHSVDAFALVCYRCRLRVNAWNPGSDGLPKTIGDIRRAFENEQQ